MRIIINESQLSLIREGMSSVLYHFTSLNNGLSICQNDKIYLQSAYSKDADNYDRKRKFYLSCTRIRNGRFGYSNKFSRGGVRIELDGDVLSNNLKGRQVNYWGGGTFTDKYKYADKIERNQFDRDNNYDVNKFIKNNPNATEDDINDFIKHNFDTDAQQHISNESEDRIFSYSPVIEDAHRYIRSVDVLIPGFENDSEKMGTAQAFMYYSARGIKVRIFDSEKEFNNPNGKDANEKVEYGYGLVRSERRNAANLKYPISAVVSFIAYGNPEFEGKKFQRSVMELLRKYELSEYGRYIGDFYKDLRSKYGILSVGDSLDSVRRDLSDSPRGDSYKVLKMLTDYMISLGANSFRDGYLKKKELSERPYKKVYDRIDTSKKERVVVINDYILSLYPNKDKFSDAVSWNNQQMIDNAESFAEEAFYDKDSYSAPGSKNVSSLFHYLYKLFRTGTVEQVYQVLSKIGFTDEYLKSWGIGIEYRDLNYWDAVRLDTVNVFAIKKKDEYNYDYDKVRKLNDKEIEEFFAYRQKQR